MSVLDQAFAEAWAHHAAGRLPEAEGIYRQILAQHPGHAGALHHLGILAHQVGRSDVAVDLIQRSVAIEPNEPTAWCNLSEVFRSLGKTQEAIACVRELIARGHENAQAYYNLGGALYQNADLEAAAVAWERAVQLNPDYGQAYSNLSAALKELERTQEAVAAGESAVQLEPNSAASHNNLATALRDAGRLDDAIAEYRRALAIDPQSPAMHSALLFAMLHHPGSEPADIFQEHLHWARRHAAPLSAAIERHVHDRNPSRRLKVGYVSPHFREHAVTRFFEPLLAHHHKEQVETTCYFDGASADAGTHRLRKNAAVWRQTRHLNDEEFARLVREDHIDILVDLTGHLSNHRLLAFARKPAPVQVTYLGYQTTTGLSVMDYRLTDAHADPATSDLLHTEKLVRLPDRFFCYLPPHSPDVAHPPVEKNGWITFGYFNHFTKLSAPFLQTVAKILRSTPDSRFMVLAPGDQSLVGELFSRQGIDLDRVDLVRRRPSAEYMKLFADVDIALDPFPFSGHTTTCDTLWMGVPVITLAGRTYAGRMSTSVLRNLNLPELIADTPEDYAQIAKSLAADRPRLHDLRKNLRPRMQGSTILDGDSFARDVESAYRDMWRKWVEG